MMTVKIGETETEKKILFAIDEDWLGQQREDPSIRQCRSSTRTIICGTAARAIC
jgi:hypothetical protein